jgi:mannose/fructose/N-acetylgalactosamine-specific phosphotransferase system component IID
MKIEIPEGYTMPEDVADGGTLEELVTFKVEGEYLVPTMIAGVEIAAEEAEDEEADMEDEATAEMEANASPMRGMGERIMGMA